MIETVTQYAKDNGLFEKCRKREVVYKRNYLYKYLVNSGYNLSETGRAFQKDHASVIHGLKQYELFKDDEMFLDVVQNEMLAFPIRTKKQSKAFESLNIDRLTEMFKIISNFNK